MTYVRETKMTKSGIGICLIIHRIPDIRFHNPRIGVGLATRESQIGI